MPYDTNNMFGVLANPESMSLLTTRGRSKQFEKELAEEIASEAESWKHTASIKIVKNINKVLGNLDSGVDVKKEGINEAETHSEATLEALKPAIPATPITPAASRIQHLSINTNNTSPRTNTSGKPSHRRRRDLTATEDQPPLTPVIPKTPSRTSTPPQQPREYFLFSNKKAYSHARALFAMTSQPDHPSSLRWNQLVILMTSPPINCEMIQNKNSIEVKVIRPARTSICIVSAEDTEIEGSKEGMKEADGNEEGAKESKEIKVEMPVEKRSVVLHKPHGQNGWVERHMLDHMATAMIMKFGWERGDFVME